MRYSAVLFLTLLFTVSAFAQPPKNSKIKKPKSAAAGKVADEKTELEKAVNEPDAATRIAALQKFIENFPNSEELTRAKELVVSARAQLGEENLAAGNTANGVEFFKAAVRDAPAPMSERLFADVVLQFPTNLFFRGQRDAAYEIAQMIEEKISGDAKQILGLATFYIGIENATNARRLANKAIELAPEMPAAYQTLGIANRLGFRLDEAVTAYSKALELDPDSVVSKRSLAEMKRANGKADEAVALYREILEKDASDANAKTGLVLSLFESGKKAEAEAEMQKLLEENANNLPLLVGAAYFFAARGDGAKAVDLAQKALAIEPRYTWANIALARGLLAEKRPLEAEKVLLAARNYGNFPTLDYEIAAARLQSGLYREAAEELRKNFAVKGGVLETYLGNRVGVEAEDFLKLLSLERRAAIFSYDAADTLETAERLKSLLEFSQELNEEEPDEAVLSGAADKFIGGDDKMKIHRQLFVAGRLLDKKKNLPKVIELTQASVKGVDTALDVPTPSAAVMADELYETRKLAISRGEVLIMPEVPRQTLSVILRGRIEELSGWSLYQQDKPAEAVVRLKRAVSVLPEDSNWWRSSIWRLGAALEADGKPDEALENYIKSYKSGEANPAKYIIIEALYQKVKGNSEGLEEEIGKRPEGVSDTIAKLTETTGPEPEVSPSPENETSPIAEPVTEPVTEPEASPSPETGTEASLPPPAAEIKQEETKREEETPTNAEEEEEENPMAETPVPTPSTETSSTTPDAETPVQIEPAPTPTPETVSSTTVSTAPETVPTETLPEPVPAEILPEATPSPEPAPTPVEKIENTDEAIENTPDILAVPTPEPEISPTPTEPEVPPSPTPEETLVSEAENEETEIKPSTVTPAETPAETLVLTTETPATVEPTPDPPPLPEPASVTKNIVVRTSESIPAETPLENALPQTSEEKPAKKETAAKTDPASKPIFEPVVINVRKKEKPEPKPAQSEQKTELPSVKIIDPLETKISESQVAKDIEAEKTKTEKSETKAPGTAALRPRVFIEDKLNITETPKCELVASQESVWLINGGGSLGILVGFAGQGDAAKITAASSSPTDIEVSLEPAIGANSGRAFFILKSISRKKGAFTVTFDSPCGKKEVQVRVR